MSDFRTNEGPGGSISSVDFRMLFESAPGLYLILAIDFTIVAVSDAYLLATKTQRKDIMGRGIFEVFPDNPEDSSATGVSNLTASLKRVVQQRVPHKMATQKYDIRRPESEGGGFEEKYWNPCNIPLLGPTGELVYIIHQVEDVTDVIRLQQQTQQQEQLVEELQRRGERVEQNFRLLVDGIKDYAIFLLDPLGNVSTWNRGAERIKGYHSEEIIGQHFSKFYLPEDRLKGLPGEALKTALTEGRFEGEGYRIRKDGSQFWASVIINPIRDKSDALIGFSKITRDASDQKQAEINARRLLQEEAARRAAEEHAEIILQQREQLRMTMHALNQSQKMEAVGQLAGGIAHDFNNLLTVILGYCKLMLSRMTPDDPLQNSLRPICEAGERAASLTRQLLAFSRQSVLEPKVLELNNVVRETEELLRRLIGEDILLAVVLEPKSGRVKVDPGQMGQVMMNLAINARDAMPKGGKLMIETRNVVLGKDYAFVHPGVDPGPYVMLAMTDTGTGMSSEVLARVFDPFFTTKGIGKGTGLGLAVVHGIVKQSGGFVEVYSELNHGTCFKIYLPAVMENAETQPEVISDKSLRGTETILLVEDEEGVRTMASIVLESYGYKVLSAGNGNEALRLTEKFHHPIDLLMTDVVMPGMGGRDLANLLHSRFPLMKMVFTSGYTNDAVVRHGLSHEDVNFLQKPYDPFSLAAKIRQVLDAS